MKRGRRREKTRESNKPELGRCLKSGAALSSPNWSAMGSTGRVGCTHTSPASSGALAPLVIVLKRQHFGDFTRDSVRDLVSNWLFMDIYTRFFPTRADVPRPLNTHVLCAAPSICLPWISCPHHSRPQKCPVPFSHAQKTHFSDTHDAPLYALTTHKHNTHKHVCTA